MSANDKPSTLVISLTEEDPKHTIKMMLGVEDLPDAIVIEEAIHAYPHRIDTKYYSADIHLCSMKSKTIGSQAFADGVGAAIIKIDPEKEQNLKEVESWLPFLSEMCPEVQILLCEKCLEVSEKGSNRVDVQRWCVENHFELVELDPGDAEEEEEDEDLPGLAVTTGIKRVMQALESHLWPNMEMKDKKNHVNPSLAAYLNGGAQENDPVTELTENLQNTQINSMMSKIDQLLGAEDEAAGDAEAGPEMEFASLLSRLSEMKQQAASLPSDQRKLCAEQVVKAFWNAIGGDEDEIFDDILQECNQVAEDDVD